jgi:hypothetical protein
LSHIFSQTEPLYFSAQQLFAAEPGERQGGLGEYSVVRFQPAVRQGLRRDQDGN